MSNQTQQRQLLAILADRFPAAFPHDSQAVRPLKIGIDQAIRQAYLDLEEQVLRHVLGGHCQRLAYLKALVRGGQRLGLEGRPVEPVSKNVASTSTVMGARPVAGRWR